MQTLSTYAICACVVFCSGCGGEGDSVKPAQLADRVSEVANDDLFTGVIKAEISDNAGLAAQKVTYTISSQQIRRETQETGLLQQTLGKALKQEVVAGVICDLEKGEVVLYRDYLNDKHFVKLSLDDYRKFISHLSYDWFQYYGCSTHFCLLTDGVPSSAKREPAALVVGERTCDRLVIETDRVLMDVAHCPTIRVDRDLLRLVDVRIPDEIAGFPCLVRISERILAPPKPRQGPRSHSAELLEKGLDDIAKAVDKKVGEAVAKTVGERVYKVVAISREKVPSSAFSVPDGYSEVKDIGAFETHGPGRSGKHHWH